MAAVSTSRSLTTLNPTSTEHDYRFPRRPEAAADSGSGAMKFDQSKDSAAAASNNTTTAAASSMAKKTTIDSSSGMRNSLKELRFDLSRTIDDAQGKLSKTQAFSGFRDGIAGMSDSPDDLAKDDPLATQIWRYFAKTKQSLPNQERMENLTWRMMHVNLRKQVQKAEESDKYAYFVHPPNSTAHDASFPSGRGKNNVRYANLFGSRLHKNKDLAALHRMLQAALPSCENRPN